MRRRPLRRRLLFGALLAAALAAALLTAGAIYMFTLRGVGDAEARVRGLLAAHHGAPSSLPPPARLAVATVTTEDESFYDNVAVNILDGVGRAALATLEAEGDPGGSTIQQQLAKRLYPHGGGVAGTLEEIGLALKLSLRYSKAEILSMYLNSVYYGNGYWGDVAAAHGYFGVSPRRLSWGEAAMLAGLLQAPSAYDPVQHLGVARRRQLLVLDQLVENHVLSAAQARAAFRQPLPLGGGYPRRGAGDGGSGGGRRRGP